MSTKVLDRPKAKMSLKPATPTSMTQVQKLLRWAMALRALGPQGTVKTLWRIEDVRGEAQRALRKDGSALSVAAADPVLQAAGLQGDTIGEAVDFFGLPAVGPTGSPCLHTPLCWCNEADETMSANLAVERIQAMAQKIAHPMPTDALGIGGTIS